jgi:hypothetical protein
MNAIKSTLSCLLLGGALLGASPGCDEGQDVGMVGGRAYPPVGSFVHVQFRRDFLGMAAEKGSSPTGGESGIELASSGELRRVTEEFVVLAVANEPDRELWIPRDAVLLMDVKRPSEPRPQ